MSTRKPHNHLAGYVAEKIYQPTRSHIVIYVAAEQRLDLEEKYAVVCEKHGTMVGEMSVPKARVLMKHPEFCEECMSASLS